MEEIQNKRFEEAKNYADYNNMLYFEISSKNGAHFSRPSQGS